THVVQGNDHAQTAGGGFGAAKNVVGWGTDVVPAGSSHASHAHHNRLFDLEDGFVDLGRAGDGATGAIDAQHNCFDAVVFSGRFEVGDNGATDGTGGNIGIIAIADGTLDANDGHGIANAAGCGGSGT